MSSFAKLLSNSLKGGRVSSEYSNLSLYDFKDVYPKACLTKDNVILFFDQVTDSWVATADFDSEIITYLQQAADYVSFVKLAEGYFLIIVQSGNEIHLFYEENLEVSGPYFLIKGKRAEGYYNPSKNLVSIHFIWNEKAQVIEITPEEGKLGGVYEPLNIWDGVAIETSTPDLKSYVHHSYPEYMMYVLKASNFPTTGGFLYWSRGSYNTNEYSIPVYEVYADGVLVSSFEYAGTPIYSEVSIETGVEYTIIARITFLWSGQVVHSRPSRITTDLPTFTGVDNVISGEFTAINSQAKFIDNRGVVLFFQDTGGDGDKSNPNNYNNNSVIYNAHDSNFKAVSTRQGKFTDRQIKVHYVPYDDYITLDVGARAVLTKIRIDRLTDSILPAIFT